LGDNEPKIECYWTAPPASESAAIPDEFEVEHLLERSVKRQMISDVPIGAFLSGGIDSSLLVAIMARHSSGRVRTFSVAFDEGDVDESSIAKIVAQRFETDHIVLHAEELGAAKLLDLLGSLDEPFCDPAFVPTYSLSEMTKRHVKVALSGDGGDEVFGGYPKYLLGVNGHFRLPFSSLFHRILTDLHWRPRGMGRVYWRTLNSAERVRFSWARYGDFPIFGKDLRQLFSSCYQEAVHIQDYFEPWERRARRYGETLDTDVLMRADLETYLSENCLVKTDRASMLASLEVRVPYLDEMILDRILPLPSRNKIPNGQLKALLMPIARRLLPREVWDRPKHGFTVPVGVRLSGAWRPAFEAALDWGERNLKFFDYRYLCRLHKINLSEGGVDRELWNPFVFLAWAMAHAR
jgi:asparagine synthase (glutamine-hydrolysing)